MTNKNGQTSAPEDRGDKPAPQKREPHNQGTSKEFEQEGMGVAAKE